MSSSTSRSHRSSHYQPRQPRESRATTSHDAQKLSLQPNCLTAAVEHFPIASSTSSKPEEAKAARDRGVWTSGSPA